MGSDGGDNIADQENPKSPKSTMGGDQQDDKLKYSSPIDQTPVKLDNGDYKDGGDDNKDGGNQKNDEDGGSQAAVIKNDSQAKP